MAHYFLELFLWVMTVFFAGCVIGVILRRLLGSEPASPPLPVQVPGAVEPKPVTAPVVLEPGRMERPRGLAEPRDNQPDNLQRISGIGPKYEKALRNLGFFHFDQIAAWTPAQIGWIDDHLKFNGRVVREEWVSQAALLAEGNEEEFKSRFGGSRRG